MIVTKYLYLRIYMWAYAELNTLCFFFEQGSQLHINNYLTFNSCDKFIYLNFILEEDLFKYIFYIDLEWVKEKFKLILR